MIHTAVAVDINHLLLQEQVHTVPVKPSLGNSSTFLSIIKAFILETYAELIATNYKIRHPKRWFAIYVNRHVFRLHEQKEDKYRQSVINIDKAQVQINKRRASTEDMSRLSEQLDQLSQRVNEKNIEVFTPLQNKQDPSSMSSTSLAYVHDIAKKCKLAAPERVNKQVLIEESFIQRWRRCLQQLAQTLKPTLKKPRQDTYDEARHILFRLKQLIIKGRIRCITNTTIRKAKGNTQYALEIRENRALFVEKSQVLKQKVLVHFTDDSLSLNKSPMKKQAQRWFLDRLEKIANDLRYGRAQLFEQPS